MPADILIYALVVAGLVFWLRSVLGTRHGDERERPNPFANQNSDRQGSDRQSQPQDAAALVPGLLPGAEGPNMLAEAIAMPKDPRFTMTAQDAEKTLLDIAKQDRGFNLAQFLQGAQDAFIMIVEAFAAGNRELLKSLLAPDVYSAFDKAISGRETVGETVVTEIHAIRKTEVTEVKLQGKTAVFTLRFVADETSVTKDKDGKIIEGNPDRVQETIDIWTFTRDIRSKDPTWFLQATREEAMGAAPTPNTAA